MHEQRSTVSRTVLLGSLFAFLPAIVRADTPQLGFELTALPYPLQSKTATLSDGRVVAFDGTRIDLFDADGTLTANLGVVTLPGYPSFLLLDPTEEFVVFGESSFGAIFELTLSPGAPNPVANLAFNYDAVFEDGNHLIVSAATGGFGAGNRIYRLELSSGTTTLLASVAGASGPVALDLAGNLLYGTVSALFPSPPGSSSVLRWPAALLTGASVLSEDDATLIETGFDGAADLAVDPVSGGIYLVENNYGNGVNRIRLVAGNPTITPVLVEGTVFRTISNLEFLPGDGVAIFAGYQPPRGGTLYYSSTDFVSVAARMSVTTLRPIAYASGPGVTGAGPFDIGVTSAPPGGFGFIFYGPSSSVLPNELVLQLRIPLFLGLAPMTAARAPGTLLVAGNGQGHLSYVSPGGLQGNWAFQAVLFDASGRLAGSSAAALFQ